MTETLYRQAEMRADASGRTVYGRVVPYGDTIEVVPGLFERFERGAFTRSIRERGSKVRLFVGHDSRRLPIGKATELDERADGVHASFELARTRDADETLELVRDGYATSFSIGFRPIRDRDEKGVIVRTEAALLEVSLVGVPAYEGAEVAGVRTASQSLTVELARQRLDLTLKAW